jgi:plastocyanin
VAGRRFVPVAAALAALAAAPAAGHPGHGPGTVSIADLSFKPQALTVARGDTVIWFWDGDDRNHSVTADPGQTESFDSDPGTPAALVSHPRNDAFSHDFDRLGTFTYHCKVHASMRGTIRVKRAPPPDETPPRLTDLRVKPRQASGRARAHFTVSEPAFVVVSIRRAGSSRELRHASAFVRRGKRRIGFGVRGLEPGAYRAVLRAEDDAGNASRRRGAGFRVAS